MERWAIRKPRSQDLDFIYATWLNSYFGDSCYYHSVRKSVYKREYAKIIDRLLSISSILIACKPDDEIVIYGYLVFEPRTIHYCYIKEAFRFSGMAKALIATGVGKLDYVQVSHQTNKLKPILEKYPFLTYNPFILFKDLG